MNAKVAKYTTLTAYEEHLNYMGFIPMGSLLSMQLWTTTMQSSYRTTL